MPWHDCDSEIESAAGMSIAQIFEQCGEERFRRLETERIRELCAEGRGAVISVGGGAPLRNGDALRRGATVIYLERDVANILATLPPGDGTRPLLKEPGALERLSRERHAIYLGLCDLRVSNNADAESAARDVLARISRQSSPFATCAL
jgi:shikimate kinase